MSNNRHGEYILEVKPEPTASGGDGFNTEDAAFSTDVKRLAIFDASPDVGYEELENQQITVNGGMNENIQGLAYPGSSVAFSSYCHGLDAATGDGVAAVNTAQSWLAAAVMGEAPSLSTGDVVAGSPTSASSFSEATGSRHAIGDVVGVVLDRGLECRMITGGSNPAIELGMALSKTPTATDVLLGSATCKFALNPTTFHTAQCRFITGITSQTSKRAGLRAR